MSPSPQTGVFSPGEGSLSPLLPPVLMVRTGEGFPDSSGEGRVLATTSAPYAYRPGHIVGGNCPSEGLTIMPSLSRKVVTPVGPGHYSTPATGPGGKAGAGGWAGATKSAAGAATSIAGGKVGGAAKGGSSGSV